MSFRTIIITAAALITAAVIAFFVFTSRSDVPSHKRMAAIMADVYMVDATVQSRGQLFGKDAQLTAESAYKSVLSRYGLTKSEFDSIVAWYSRHPDEYSEVYLDVVSILSEKEAAFSTILAKRDSINQRIESLRDSIRQNIWDYSKVIRLPLKDTDTVPSDLVFDYPLDSLRGGWVTFYTEYVFPRRNEATDTAYMQLIVQYRDTIADTISTTFERSYISKKNELKLDISDTIPAVALKAQLMKSEQLKETTVTFTNVRLYYMPYEITDSVQFDEIRIPPLFTY